MRLRFVMFGLLVSPFLACRATDPDTTPGIAGQPCNASALGTDGLRTALLRKRRRQHERQADHRIFREGIGETKDLRAQWALEETVTVSSPRARPCGWRTPARASTECASLRTSRQRRSSGSGEEHTIMIAKNTVCLWFDKDAEAAARFYAATFPNSEVRAVHKAPADYPAGKEGNVLTVDFTVLGIPCLGLNGGPHFTPSEAFSFQIATDDQEETDRYWNAIVNNGGKESDCGWCKDRWGLSWQITPRTLTEALAAGGAEAKRAFSAMMTMKKIDVATIDAARRG